MADQPPAAQTPPDVPHRLHAIAQLLRESEHLEPDAQQALAELLDELGNALTSPSEAGAEAAHLTETTAQLVQALHAGEEPRKVATARSRLQEAILRAEAKAPVAAGIANRLIDTLSNIGI